MLLINISFLKAFAANTGLQDFYTGGQKKNP